MYMHVHVHSHACVAECTQSMKRVYLNIWNCGALSVYKTSQDLPSRVQPERGMEGEEEGKTRREKEGERQ